jgi:hypothetical protein
VSPYAKSIVGRGQLSEEQHATRIDLAPFFSLGATEGNLHRRHLTQGQQAAGVASAQDWSMAQTVGKPKSGNVTGLTTVAERAAVSGVSEKTQRMADAVAKADPELAKKVAHGEVPPPPSTQHPECVRHPHLTVNDLRSKVRISLRQRVGATLR